MSNTYLQFYKKILLYEILCYIYIDPWAYFACFQHEFENICNEVQSTELKTISTSIENSMQNMPEGRLMLTFPTGKNECYPSKVNNMRSLFNRKFQRLLLE